MGYSPFVKPKIIRLPIASLPGHFIDVKDRLNAGELEDLHAKWQPLIKGGRGVELQTREIRFSKVLAYLLAWSFTDDDGQPVDVNEGAVGQLEPPLLTEIHKMIEAHEEKRDKEIEAMKADPPGATESNATSPSVARWEAGITAG